MGSVILAASSNHLGLTMQVTDDTLQSWVNIQTGSKGPLKSIENLEILNPICYQKDLLWPNY